MKKNGSKAVIPSHLVVKGFILAFLFTVVILAGLAWYMWGSNRHLKMLETTHFRLLQLSGKIIHIDEILTMSAHMAVETGELQWEERYRKFEPQLDSAIKEVMELSPEQFMKEAISQTDTANVKLVAMENQSFDLVRRGQIEMASKVLHSTEYTRQKQVYSNGINEISNTISTREKARIKEEQRIALTVILFLIVTMPLVAFIWLSALRILRRYIIERKQTELSLRMAEQRFKAIADYSFFWEVWVSPGGNPVWTNPAVEQVTGYSADELMAMRDYPTPLVFKEDREKVDEAFKSALEGSTGREMEFRLLRKDGTIIWVESAWQPIFDDKGVSQGHRVSIHDIMYRKQAQQALLESEQRFRDFFENAPIGFHIFGPDRIIIDINDAELEMIGYSREAIVGKKTWAELIVPQQRDMFKKHWHDITTKGHVRDLEYTLVHKDGHHIDVILNASARFDKEGNVLNTRGSVLDITVRKKAMENLRISEANYHSIFDSANDAIFVHDIENAKILSVNQKACEMFGYTQEELKKLTVGDISTNVLPYDQEHAVQWIKKAAKEGPQLFEWVCKHKTGRNFWVEVNLKLAVIEGENRMLAILRDITERKHAEQARQRLNKELEAKNKELESILYAASHDLKSPLVNIQGFGCELAQSCELLRSILDDKGKITDKEKVIQTALGEDIPKALDYILASSTKMDALLSGLLDVSRLNNAAAEVKHINLNAMMSKITESMKYQLKESAAEIDVETLPPCAGDPLQINRVFTNLLTNALKFLDESRPGRIRIYGKRQGDKNIYCVEDNGIGIAPEHQEKMFQIFYQHEPEKRQGEGIGLTIVRRIIEKHDGKVWVESEPGKGSKFFVSLPTVNRGLSAKKGKI